MRKLTIQQGFDIMRIAETARVARAKSPNQSVELILESLRRRPLLTRPSQRCSRLGADPPRLTQPRLVAGNRGPPCHECDTRTNLSGKARRRGRGTLRLTPPRSKPPGFGLCS